jgi:hypothetical protein
MPLPKEATIFELKPFAHKLLSHKDTLWSVPKHNPIGNEIVWSTLLIDIDVLTKIMRIVHKTAGLSDAEYLKTPYQDVRAEMSRSKIFDNLNSADIVTTKGQEGRTPLVHIEEVIHSLNTANLPQRYKIMERLCAIYHDVGKGISAGINRESVSQLMTEYNHKKHSHPNHDKISALALQTMGTQKWVQEEATKIYPHFWSDFVFMVLHHHIYEDIKEEKTEGSSEPKIVIPQETRELANPMAAYLIFTFSHADINSNVKYQQYWPDKVVGFAQLMREKWPNLENILKIDNWRNSQ